MNELQLHTVLKRFAISTANYRFQEVNNGYINDTYLVLVNTFPKYILQRINSSVFSDTEGLMQNIQQAFRFLDAADYAKIELKKTKTGAGYYRSESNESWRLMTFIAESTTYNTTKDPKIAFEAGRILGRFHQLMAKAPSHLYTPTIPDFHSISLRKVQFETAVLAQNQPEKIRRTAALQDLIATLMPHMVALSEQAQPLRVCHNDTKLNNILFAKNDHKGLCFIDLDTLMPGYFYYDFGDTVRTLVNTAPEDEQDLSKITFNEDLFQVCIDGLGANGPLLSRAEINALPMGAVYMPFMHGLRAYTDYLNGNVYYKVAYADQNLDRSKSLFHFSQLALEKVPYMKSVLASTLRGS